MKIIASIKSPSEQGLCIATVYQDDGQTGEYLLKDPYSSQGYWFKTLEELQDSLTEIDFIKGFCRLQVSTTPYLRGIGTYPIVWYDETRFMDRVNFIKQVKI